ncbi:hypothetical protein DRQ09_06285 [candidate division KSB1 bacterium]|nr:MAG: hypothetical protein DRQ09_06285 [candidate division KSB1 bacterium]
MFDKEKEIIKRIKNGEVDQFRILYEENKEMIYRICFKYAGDKEVAKDLLQETFIKAYESLGKFRGDSSFSSWIFKIAVNRCLTYSRNVRLRKNLKKERENTIRVNLSMKSTDLPGQKFILKEFKEKVEEILKGFSSKERMIFTLKHFENFKINEVSEIMGISEGTVKSTLHKVIKKLRKKLELFFEEKGFSYEKM